MAYRIDFTESKYVGRKWRKIILNALFLSCVAGAVWGVRHVYKVYNQPTLNMKLSEYESVVRPIEEIDALWDKAAKEYGTQLKYYRLLWAANPTNFLGGAVSSGVARLKRGFTPVSWTLTTGGECKLEYRYTFSAGDKAAQADGLEAVVSHAVTSVIDVVGGKVDVQGVLHENLLHVEEFGVSAKFSLPDVKSFPVKERALAECVSEIVSMRKKVQDSKITDVETVKGTPSTAKGIMMAYLPMGKDKPGFPDFVNVINVSGWFQKADGFIEKNRIPGNAADRRKLMDIWNKIGDARFPWDRYRALDNDELAFRIRELGVFSDGVKRLKGFLDGQHADCRRRLKPFVNAYEHNNVFNEPLVESDLRDRVAKAAGITDARVAFKDETGADPAVLETDDEKFTFSWVRWTLSFGSEAGDKNTGNNSKDGNAAGQPPVTLQMLTDCAVRAQRLGPGYAIEKIKIGFTPDGAVSGAVLEGLLPVKNVESKKGTTGNVN